MSIKFACTCGKAYKVPEKFSGKRVKCKQCGEALLVPSQSQTGVVSQRASAVSKRSMLDDGSKRSSRRSSRSSSRSSGGGSSSSSSKRSSSSKSGRSKSQRTSKRVKKAKPGSDTETFKAIDLQEGNQVKKYQKKKSTEDDEFARGTGRLTYFEGAKPVKAFRLNKKEIVIGRDESCGVQLPLASVSRRHARIEYKLGVFILTDEQSSNGLVINGRVVRRGSLKGGDIIQLGQAILRVDC